MTIFAALAEWERGLIKERTNAGIQAAEARGQKLGRPVKLGKAQLEHAENLINEGRELGEVATLLGVHRSTLYRRLTS